MTHLAATDAVGRKRKSDVAFFMDASETLTGKRNRAMGDAMDSLGDPPGAQEKRCRGSDPHAPFVADEVIVKDRAQWREPEMKARWDFTHS